MKKNWTLAALSLALAAAYPAASAATNDDILNELKTLKAKMSELEKKLQAQEEKQAEVQPGMTPEQQSDFNRIATKTEALEDSREAMGFAGLKIGGYMDPVYVFNQRSHRAGFQFLNPVTDGAYSYDNSYIGGVVLDILKETDTGTRWHLALAPQRGTQSVAESNTSIVQEASVSVPLTDLQTRFIAGHLPDWSGYEMLQPTLNKLVTHNLLFDFTLPASYTGAGLELTRSKWIIKAMLANMNASKRADNEKTPVLTYRVDYAKGEYQGFGFAGLHGKAKNGNAGGTNPVTTDTYSSADTRIDLFEFDTYFIRGDVTAQAQFSLGRQRKASITPDSATGELRDAYWSGVSALVAYKFEPRLEGVLRFDHIFNKKNGGGLLTYTVADAANGIGPGMVFDGTDWVAGNADKGVDRSALSLGLNYTYNMNTLFKVEYRLDRATGAVFQDAKDGSFKKNNQMLGTSVVVSF